MKNSKISWCDHTFNPWIGCTKVSPGCANCYAKALNKRFAGGANWGLFAPRRRTSVDYWRKPFLWNAEYERALNYFEEVPTYAPAGSILPKEPSRPRVFCGSICDVFDKEVPPQWLADLFALINATPSIDWLLLTKRPQNWLNRTRAACYDCDYEETNERYLINSGAWSASWMSGKPPANVWLGTSVEDQQRADERIPLLLAIPAKVRFLSCEPLLSAVNLRGTSYGPDWLEGWDVEAVRTSEDECEPQQFQTEKIDWVICGSESGPKRREMKIEWASSLRDQCAAAGVPFFMKQLEVAGKVAHDPDLFPQDLRVQEFPSP
mgnify:CR=1 FL=1